MGKQYRCPHCTGQASKINGTDQIKCEGQVHCQFIGEEDDFEVIEDTLKRDVKHDLFRPADEFENICERCIDFKTPIGEAPCKKCINYAC